MDQVACPVAVPGGRYAESATGCECSEATQRPRPQEHPSAQTGIERIAKEGGGSLNQGSLSKPKLRPGQGEGSGHGKTETSKNLMGFEAPPFCAPRLKPLTGGLYSYTI